MQDKATQKEEINLEFSNLSERVAQMKTVNNSGPETQSVQIML
jgi:hypothetical protein